jgi:hypothetical protein
MTRACVLGQMHGIREVNSNARNPCKLGISPKGPAASMTCTENRLA